MHLTLLLILWYFFFIIRAFYHTSTFLKMNEGKNDHKTRSDRAHMFSRNFPMLRLPIPFVIIENYTGASRRFVRGGPAKQLQCQQHQWCSLRNYNTILMNCLSDFIVVAFNGYKFTSIVAFKSVGKQPVSAEMVKVFINWPVVLNRHAQPADSTLNRKPS